MFKKLINDIKNSITFTKKFYLRQNFDTESVDNLIKGGENVFVIPINEYITSALVFPIFGFLFIYLSKMYDLMFIIFVSFMGICSVLGILLYKPKVVYINENKDFQIILKRKLNSKLVVSVKEADIKEFFRISDGIYIKLQNDMVVNVHSFCRDYKNYLKLAEFINKYYPEKAKSLFSQPSDKKFLANIYILALVLILILGLLFIIFVYFAFSRMGV